MSDDRAELLAAIRAKAVVRGDFVLSSGRRADFYVDLRRILLDGRVAPLAGRVMLDLTADLGYDASRRAHPGRRPGGRRDHARRGRPGHAGRRVCGAEEG